MDKWHFRHWRWLTLYGDRFSVLENHAIEGSSGWLLRFGLFRWLLTVQVLWYCSMMKTISSAWNTGQAGSHQRLTSLSYSSLAQALFSSCTFCILESCTGFGRKEDTWQMPHRPRGFECARGSLECLQWWQLYIQSVVLPTTLFTFSATLTRRPNMVRTCITSQFFWYCLTQRRIHFSSVGRWVQFDAQ